MPLLLHTAYNKPSPAHATPPNSTPAPAARYVSRPNALLGVADDRLKMLTVLKFRFRVVTICPLACGSELPV